MPSRRALTPARIDFAWGGAPYAIDFDDVYHSADGGPEQARHVFLAGNGLPERWRRRRRFTILETGFGLGLNFLCTAAALLADPGGPAQLHYVAVEKRPPLPQDLERAHAHWPQFAALAERLRRHWPPLLKGFHRIEPLGPRISLTLALGDAAEMLAELDPACVDAIYLDGFAPAKNPHMWSEAVYRQLARIGVAGTTAATWSVAAAVRAGLRAVGFAVETRRGFGRKREMLTAVLEQGEANPARDAHRRAIVVGAGVAGCWAAHRLARRGWEIRLLEQHSGPAQEASGNAVGAVLPALNLADNANARMARAAFLWARQLLSRYSPSLGLWRETGVLQLALTSGQAERMALILATHDFPGEYAQWTDLAQASERAEHAVCGPGWWIPGGGWAAPAPLCRALLDEAAGQVTALFDAPAHRVTRVSNGWAALDATGKVIAEAPVVVLANARAAARLGVSGLPPLVSVRGQVTHLPPTPMRGPKVVVCGDGYVAPMPQGGHCVGATFEPDSVAIETRVADHARNLARAARMLPGYAAALDPARLTGRVGLRTATPDRLPACGRLLDATTPLDGLYLITGLGSRGLIWAPLCAEVLASRLDSAPNPIEASLVAALDPHRWRIPG